MDKISVADARKVESVGKHVTIQGWVRTRRDSKAGFQNFVQTALQHGVVDELTVWDFEWPEGGDDKSRPVQFKAKPNGGMAAGLEYYYLVKARFVREADGQWRLKGFDVYNPFVDGNRPLDIPGLQ